MYHSIVYIQLQYVLVLVLSLEHILDYITLLSSLLDSIRPSGLDGNHASGGEEKNKKAAGVVLLPLVHGLGTVPQVIIDFNGLLFGAM
jgi:hypothetical protein